MVLEYKNVTKKFNGLCAVDDVSFYIDKNEVVGIVGPNGSGKTTCFNLITGIYPVTEGEILFHGENIENHKPHEISRKGIARTFQISSVFPNLSVTQNIITAQYNNYRSGFFTDMIAPKRIRHCEKEAVERSRELLDYVGLGGFGDKTAKTLTAADQRRLMVAIALATSPKLLLLDEPCAGMNYDEQIAMFKLIRDVCEDGTPVLLVEHHMRMIMNVCDRVIVLNLGRKIAEGEPQEISQNKDVIEAYLEGIKKDAED